VKVTVQPFHVFIQSEARCSLRVTGKGDSFCRRKVTGLIYPFTRAAPGTMNKD